MNPMRREATAGRDGQVADRSELDPVTPRQRRVIGRLEERARRTELLAALAGAGGLAPERAANVLCAELGELETSAAEVGLDGLGAMARAARRVVEHLGSVQVAHWRQRDVIVLDDNEITRDLITLALQAEGHRVRTAATVFELSYLVRERKPHVLLSEARMPDAPGARFCNYLRVTMALEKIPIVMFSSAHGEELALLAHEAGADLYLSKDQGIGDLMAEVARLFEEILW
ncbi:MAG TPA: response regulator [Kofleriaceae bacterium]|nr:response regulator [Kofleriaceae bacterium]